jgi:hypothetical protein
MLSSKVASDLLIATKEGNFFWSSWYIKERIDLAVGLRSKLAVNLETSCGVYTSQLQW